VLEPVKTSRTASAELSRPQTSRSVSVWDWPLRLWHWALTIFVLIAWVTPSTHDGLHRVAGYAVIGLLVFRLGWGFLGTRHSRFRRLVPRLRAAPTYLWSIRHRRTGRYLGLNPAGTAMLMALLAMLTLSSVTGAMQVTVSFFGVWWVEDTHTYSSDAVIILVVLHIIGTVLTSILQRENLPLAMITGRKRRRGSG
jgi:cytochrome b